MILCPTCPLCSQPPHVGLDGLSPWFCGTDDCPALCWDPYSSLEENLTNAGPVEVTETLLPLLPEVE